MPEKMGKGMTLLIWNHTAGLETDIQLKVAVRVQVLFTRCAMLCVAVPWLVGDWF